MKTIIYQSESPERLDKFLNLELTDFSRSQIQKLIKVGFILVNGQTTNNHYGLKQGDKIIIRKTELEQEEKILIEPEIIQEADDYLIINKPAGLIVHPTEGLKEKTLTDYLKERYPEIAQVGDDPLRPGLVHRLDKDVSGLMILARNQKMFMHLKEQFQNRTIEKKYLALVHGQVLNDHDIINFPLKRSKLSGKMVSKPKGEAGKDSITEFDIKQRFVNYTFLDVNLKTGRSHQIRAHLQAYGHPLVGDKLYKNKKLKVKIELNRIFLHSYYLSFTDLAGEIQTFEQPLPDQLNDILKKLT